MGISLHRGPLENLEGRGFIYPELFRNLKVGSGNTASLPVWEPCEGNLEEVSFTGDREGYVKEGSLHRGPTGEPGRGLVYWGL